MITVRQAVSATLRASAQRRESRTRLLTASVGALVVGVSLSWTPQVLAQQATSSSSSDSSSSNDQLQEVEVTGSRIKRTTDFTTASPTTVIDTTAMENAGVVNVGDVLAMTPANISSFTPQTTGNGSFNTGAYIPDLRGLNPFFGSRTLTLIDGQRAVSTNTMDSFDLNFIPQILVQRVDTVTGGGSAAYGSGAVAGVINVILDHQLEGGKLDADWYDTHYNDARQSHVSAAYGHGLFDNRVHFVIGAEYQKQDPALCQSSGRAWCSANYGPYDYAYNPAQTTIGLTTRATGLTSNVNPSGVIGLATYNPTTYNFAGTTGSLYSASEDGVDLLPFTANNSVYGGNSTAAGGSGEPVNEYTNLITGSTRGLISATMTAKITDSITASVDLNWGKVEALNPGGLTGSYLIGTDNPFLPAGTAQALQQISPFTNLAVMDGTTGYTVSKDWTSQIPEDQYSNTTLKRVSVNFDGKIGDTSWTWGADGQYGETYNVQGSPHEFTEYESSMALDATSTSSCRVGAGGTTGLAAAAASAAGAYNGGFYGLGLPTYLQAYNQTLGSFDPVSPVTGLNLQQQLALLSQNCVPLNPFGTSALTPGAAAYATGSLSLTLQESLTSFALNTSGDIWQGIGAGAWSMAAGYEWHQEVVHNDFSSCPGVENSIGQTFTAAQELCLARTTDFLYQFGNDYGGRSTFNEVYTELDLPLLKNAPFAKTLELDLTGRDSFYNNTALYGVDVTPGAQSAGALPTWKESLVWEPLDGVRFRASQSHDSRAPDPRDLYYSQSFVMGGAYGTCYNGTYSASEICSINLLGNVHLKPETANTTTAGVVLTPVWIQGLQASVDWFHIRLNNGINGGNAFVDGTYCYEQIQSYCNQAQFNSNYYNSAGQVVAAGTSGALTGAQAYQKYDVANIESENGAAYNGAFMDERGVDLSLSYITLLPGGSSLSVRALTTWVGEQVYQNVAGAAVNNVLGETGYEGFLADYQPAARWRGNIFVTWNVGNFALTPSINWVGEGTINNYGLTCSAGDLANTSSPCNWAYNNYTTTSGLTAAQLASETAMKNTGLYSLLPSGTENHMPAYFNLGLNAAYTFNNIPGLKGLQVWGQVNNLLNKAPPNNNSTTTNPVFYDQMGMAYRVGFRMSF